MAFHFHDIRPRELVNDPTMRMGRYLIDMGLFEESFGIDIRRESQPGGCQDPAAYLTTLRIETDGPECSICLVEFKKNEEVKTMPCKHFFHETCIMTWLKQKNTCPFCRFQLPVVKIWQQV